jgi:hypothetical protein
MGMEMEIFIGLKFRNEFNGAYEMKCHCLDFFIFSRDKKGAFLIKTAKNSISIPFF